MPVSHFSAEVSQETSYRVSKLQKFISAGCFLSRSETMCGSPNSATMLYSVFSSFITENWFVFMHIPQCKSRQIKTRELVLETPCR